MHIRLYPVTIHLPTATLLNTFVESSIPVIAPSGESSNESPRLPSLKPSRCFIPGIEATHIPNKRLDAANKKPTANAGLFLINEEKFLSMLSGNKKPTELEK
jgi:hypothetical protein